MDRIKDLEPPESKTNKIIELGTPADKTNNVKRIKIKETIKNGLEKEKIMIISKRKKLEKIESKLVSLKETERMARFNIEETKGKEIELKGLESEPELEQKFKGPILKKTRTGL